MGNLISQFDMVERSLINVEHANTPVQLTSSSWKGLKGVVLLYVLLVPVQDIMDSVADWLATLMDNYKVILVSFPGPKPPPLQTWECV